MSPLLAQRGGKGLASAVFEFARSGFRMREASRTLGIHPNTLRYRLGRAAEALGVRFDDNDVRFELSLAARLLEDDAP